MKKCIIRYKYKDENFNCWCSKECKGCSSNNLRSEDKCKVEIGRFCTCRRCGERKKVAD